MQKKKEEVHKIIKELSDDIFNVSPNQKTGLIIKEIDKLIQKAYLHLYNVSDTKHILKSVDKKNGHCC